MNIYLLVGALAGFLCGLIYVGCAYRRKQSPTLGDVIQHILSGTGFASGVKIALFSLSGQFSKLIKVISPSGSYGLSDDDTIYFFIGGVALIWLSFETVLSQFRKLWTTPMPALPPASQQQSTVQPATNIVLGPPPSNNP